MYPFSQKLIGAIFTVFVASASANDITFSPHAVLTEEMLKNSWSAMDQAYPRSIKDRAFAKLPIGTPLHSHDNQSQAETSARKMPWNIKNDFLVQFDTGIAEQGGRSLIYQDSKNGNILVSMMGTNGDSDSQGWEANLRDMASMQFIKYGKYGAGNQSFSLERTVLDEVYRLTMRAKNSFGIPKVIFVGDSKGGAQAQLLMASYLRARDDFPKGLTSLRSAEYAARFVPNTSLALVAHSAPGAVEPIKRAGYDTNTKRYAGIEMHYSFSYNARYSEIVASIGGQYLGVGGDNPKAKVVRYKTDYWKPAEMHRLTESGKRYFEGGRDFHDMEPTKKPVLLSKTQDLADLVAAVKIMVQDYSTKEKPH